MENGRYRANIGFKGKRYHLGTFETLEEALAARQEAENRLHKQFLKEFSSHSENLR